MSESNNLLKNKPKKAKKKYIGFLHFFYSSKNGTVLGRDCKSWGMIVAYYLLFYWILTGFFVGMISVFLYGFMKESEPYRTGQNSILTFTPGFNVYPRLSIESGLIVISTIKNDSFYLKYKSAVNKFFNKSFNVSSNNSVECKTDADQPTDVSRFCKFSNEDLGPCIDPVGQMEMRKLCVYVRINKIFGWAPSMGNDTAMKDILIDCQGQNAGDIVNLGQPTYFPQYTEGLHAFGKISSKFFPFINQKGYISPMIAVQFPQMKSNTAVLVQCQARNVLNAYKSIKFEIMLLDKRV